VWGILSIVRRGLLSGPEANSSCSFSSFFNFRSGVRAVFTLPFPRAAVDRRCRIS